MNIPDKKYIHSITLSQCSPYNYIWETDNWTVGPPSDDTNTGCTVHDAYVRNRVSWTCIQSPFGYSYVDFLKI